MSGCSSFFPNLSKTVSDCQEIQDMQAELNSVKEEANDALQQLEKQLLGYEAESAEVQAFLQDKASLLRQAAEVEQRFEAERASAALRLRYFTQQRIQSMPFAICKSLDMLSV